jgi:hypothetical protein
MIKQVSAFVVLAFMGLMSVGCCANKPINVTVSLDDAMRQSLQDRKIEVDIVALNAKQAERWETYSMTDYWRPGDTLYGSVPTKSFVFDPTKADAQTLWTNDPIWNQWLANARKDDVMQLYVLALLPGMTVDQPGDKDPRRQILPLNSCRWDKVKEIRLMVQKTGIITITPPKPEDN